MAFTNQGSRVGEAVLMPGNGDISFETVIILSGEVLGNNAVLGLVTASGKYVEHDPAGADGSENAIAVLVGAVDATTGDTNGVAVVRLCTVSEPDLLWKTGIIAGDITDGLTSLATANIIGRSE